MQPWVVANPHGSGRAPEYGASIDFYHGERLRTTEQLCFSLRPRRTPSMGDLPPNPWDI